MRFWPIYRGLQALALLGVLGAAPAHAQSEIGRPDPVEPPAQEEPAAIAPARKPATPAPKPAATPAAKPVATQESRPPVRSETAKNEPPKTNGKADSRSDAKPDAKLDVKPTGDLNPAERIAILNALSWSGDYGAAADGEDPLTTAIKNFQKRNNAKVTGTLTPEERDRLLAAARTHESDYGWRVVEDAATGARIGLPTKMVPIRQDTRDGTRWRSKHGDVQVETFRVNNGLALAALFELEKKQPTTRKVEYSALRPDGFVISGLQGLRKFSVRAQVKNGDIRGFTLQFDQAMEGIVEPIANAMANTYAPFPPGAPVLASALSRKVEYGSAVVVGAQGYLVTDRRLTDGCQVLIASGYGPAELIAGDHEFSLLRIYGARNLAPAVLADDAANADTATRDVTARGVPEPQAQDGQAAVKETAVKITATQVQPSPGAGYSGGGVFDASGKLAGLLSVRPIVLASVDPVPPQASVLPLTALREFLAAQNIARGAPAGKPTVMRLICVR